MNHDGNHRASVIKRPRLKLWAGNVRRRVYENLRSDEFRLLEISSHAKDDADAPLECSLRRIRLSDISPEIGYTAVSYTWADSTAHWTVEGSSPKQVLINGHVLPRVQRLEPMLRTLCDFNYTTAWIDAICIDQDDPAERASQVARMREIYSKASKTVIFLGSPTAHSDAFFEALDAPNTTGALVGPEAMPTEAMNGVLEIFQSPYWKRAWIVQEIAVSRSVELICGSRSCSWESFVAMTFRWDVGNKIEDFASRTRTLDREIRAIDTFRRERQMPLLNVLFLTRTSIATLPLDSVYAKLGLAKDADELVPMLTYKISPAKLFKALARAYIEKKNDLYIICLTRATKNPSIQLPSWVPDWTQSAERHSLLRFFYSGWMKVAHMRHRRMHVTFARSASELCVRGTILDTIGPLSSSKSWGLDQDATIVFPAICRAAVPDHFALPSVNDLCTSATGFIDQFAMHACLYDTRGDSACVYISNNEETPADKMPTRPLRRSDEFDGYVMRKNSKVVAADRFQNWYKKNRRVRIGAETVADWASLYLRSKYSPDGPFPQLNILRTLGIEVSLAVMSWYRRLTGTISGRPALVPGRAVDGDLICRLYGCPVPVVLRKTSRAYILLGECYVDGLMDERLPDGHDETQCKDITFNIR